MDKHYAQYVIFERKIIIKQKAEKKCLLDYGKLLKRLGDEKTQKFCEEILNVYCKHNVNGHIEWKRR